MLIQTDKSTYKAGDKVEFRVLVIDVHTKPYDCQSVRVSINDVNQNNVYQIELSNSLNGVYQGSLQLSDDALLGVWGISVNIDNSEVVTKKSFDVSSYSLPRFEAVIDTKSAISLSDENLKLDIFGKYTFSNAFVKGKATLTFKVYNKLNKPPVKETSKLFNSINKKESFQLNLQKDLGLEDAQISFVRISLVYVEDLTRKTVSVEKVVRVDAINEKIFKIKKENKFRSGLPYHVRVILRNENGELVQKTNEKVTLTVTYYNKPETNSSVCTKDAQQARKDNYAIGATNHYSSSIENGEAEFKVQTFKENNAISLSFTYKNFVQTINVFRAPSRSREYIKASIRGEDEK